MLRIRGVQVRIMLNENKGEICEDEYLTAGVGVDVVFL